MDICTDRRSLQQSLFKWLAKYIIKSHCCTCSLQRCEGTNFVPSPAADTVDTYSTCTGISKLVFRPLNYSSDQTENKMQMNTANPNFILFPSRLSRFSPENSSIF